MGRVWRWYRDFERSADAYGVVVLMLVLLIVLAGALGPTSETGAGIVTAVLGGAVAVLSLRASRVPGWVEMTALVLWATALVGSVQRTGSAMSTMASVAMGILLLAAPIAILARIVRHRTVSIRTVYGAIAVYLQIGIAFSMAYLVAYRIDPGAFPAVAASSVGTFVYYSFVTLTTVGYGDIVPATASGRTLAIFEALTGQIFLVVVVARIVALLGSEARLGRDEDAAR